MESRHLVTIGLFMGIGSCLFADGKADGAVIMDQIGTSSAFFAGMNADLSDNFEASFANYDTSLVDDFTISAPMVLTNVSAATLGFGSFASYSRITGWEVAIYSSMAAANSSLTGNVYDSTFLPASVSVTAPFGSDTDAESALVSIPTNIMLNAGTYYVAVLADNAFTTNGELGVYITTALPGSNPGGLNAFQVNPGGGFGGVGGASADAAYRITGTAVPEPTTTLTVIGMVGGILGLSRRRRSTLTPRS